MSVPSTVRFSRRVSLAAHLTFASAVLAAPALASPADRTHAQALAQVLPADGHHSRIALGASIVTLVRAGVIDHEKFAALYAPRGGLPRAVAELLDRESKAPIVLTRDNAALYVNLLWPIGLANRMAANRDSPLNGELRHRLASTGGWTLGRHANGGIYFNSVRVVELSARQEALVAKVARNSFRPCCNNSTFFQDCNHGSALLGLLALGASQGLGEAELYREALAFNAYWFPRNYLHTALYFKAVRGVEWRDAAPATVLGAAFSSADGWSRNVVRTLQDRGIVPQQPDADCSA